MSTMTDWITPMLAPVVGTIAGGLVGHITGHRKATAEARKANAEARKAEAEAEDIVSTSLSSVIDARLRMLIEGYEKRIADLSAEVHYLRDEVSKLRQALDQRSGLQRGTVMA